MLEEIKIAIVEDSEEDLTNCLKMLHQYEKEKDLHFIIESYSSGDAFLDKFKGQFDFLILDINLSALSGMDVAQKVREKDEEVVIMFVTNLARYATKGYEVGAIDFAIKPLTYPSFYLKMERVMKRLSASSHEDSSLVINTGGGFVKTNINNIFYVEIFSHLINFHLENSTLSTYGTLKEYEEKLSGSWFIRCNSCYLVNAKKIKMVDKYTIYLTNGETVIISHPKKKHFLERFKEYILKEGK